MSTDESHRLGFVRTCFRTKFDSCCFRKAVNARAAGSPIDTTTPVHDSFLTMMEHTSSQMPIGCTQKFCQIHELSRCEDSLNMT